MDNPCKPITLTDRAAAHVKGFMARSPQVAALRLAVKPTGCSGYQYVVELAQDIGSRDSRFESQGIAIVIDDQSLPYLQGTEVDYTREGLNQGFRFANPNVSATCGCGESFSID
jgi:iron-sulfur cluster assembly protein